MRLTCQSAPTSTILYNANSNNGNLRVEDFTNSDEPITHAMNEIVLHRGRSPHLTRLNISIDGVFLTEAIVLSSFIILT
jgi:NAD kinase